jgi:hypothetical protein
VDDIVNRLTTGNDKKTKLEKMIEDKKKKMGNSANKQATMHSAESVTTLQHEET